MLKTGSVGMSAKFMLSSFAFNSISLKAKQAWEADLLVWLLLNGRLFISQGFYTEVRLLYIGSYGLFTCK